MAKRTIAIGDIHGCLSHFEALLDAIAPASDDHLVLLGDYIDRGPDSAGVVALILKLDRSHHVTALMGNHEQMFLEAKTSREKHSDWVLNGGDTTLRSYGGVRGTLRDVPHDHRAFLEKRLVNGLETDTHIFVHANLCRDLALADQPDYMLRWERCDHISPHGSGKTIVCGHTPQTSGQPMNRGFAVCLDTHACAGRVLTGMDVDSGRIWQADGSRRVSRSHISDYSAE